MMDEHLNVFENIILDIVYNSHPIKETLIVKEMNRIYGIKVGERCLRKYIKAINKKFIDGDIDFMLIGKKQGVIVSDDPKEIEKYNAHKKHHALSELYMSYNASKQLNNLNREGMECG